MIRQITSEQRNLGTPVRELTKLNLENGNVKTASMSFEMPISYQMNLGIKRRVRVEVWTDENGRYQMQIDDTQVPEAIFDFNDWLHEPAPIYFVAAEIDGDGLLDLGLMSRGLENSIVVYFDQM